MAEGTSRLAVAAHPVVMAALAVLVVNDHVLKAWSADQGVAARTVTGKASDVTGVLLLAVLLGVVTGRRRVAVVVVGLGFVALKLSPAVAEAAAPLLGGPTRTDPWDLLALGALVPADRLLRRVDGRPAPDLRPAWASLRATVGLAVVVLSVPAMTATSCPTEAPGLVSVGLLDADTLVAGEEFTGDDDPWADPDGGRRLSATTLPSSPPTAPPLTTSTSTTTTVPGPTDPTEPEPDDIPATWWVSDDAGRTWRREPADAAAVRALRAELPRTGFCAADGCIRTDGSTVEEGSEEDGWRTTFAYSDGDRERVEAGWTSCRRPRLGLGEMVEVDGAVVVGAGTAGILRRPAGGEWEQVGVDGWEPPGQRPPAWPRQLRWTPSLAIVVLALLQWATVARSPARTFLRPLSALLAAVGAVLGGVLYLLSASLGASPRSLGNLTGTATGIVLAVSVLPLVPLLIRPRSGPSGRRT